MTEETEHVQLLFNLDEGGSSGTAWTVGDATFTEELNRPFLFELELHTTDMEAEPITIIGKSCTISIVRGTVYRQVMGIVTEVLEGSSDTLRISTKVVVVPALEVARHRVDTRIFQGDPVPKIIKDVLGEALKGFQRTIDDQTGRTYPACEYRTQYNESDLDFCHRLMEEEGILYWFDFSDKKEKLVLADEKTKFGEIKTSHDSDSNAIQFSLFGDSVGGHEYISEFHLRSRIRPTKIKTRYFDWTHSTLPGEEDSSKKEQEKDIGPGARVAPDREVYEHDKNPITYFEYSDGKGFEKHDLAERTALRRQARAYDAAIAHGESTVLGMTIGGVFQLDSHPRVELNDPYQVLSVTHSFTGEDDAHAYGNRFRCIHKDFTYRPKHATPKPKIPATQTALVVGGGSDEICTDKHGRIKVQFHWDRKGKKDDKASCFIRVRQPWAHQGWGFVFIPRVGMEVIVHFVHGDPDRPLVTGCLYNAQNVPPYDLPAEKTKSTIKTSSSLGGKDTKFNEVRFEDKAGSEQIYVHAQKDYDEVVLSCHTTDVGANQTNTVEKDQLQEVDGNQDEEVTGNQKMTVDSDRDVKVAAKFTETIDGGHTRTVEKGGVDETIEGGETRDVKDKMDETINGDRTQAILGATTETISGQLKQTITGAVTINTTAPYVINSNSAVSFTADMMYKESTPASTSRVANTEDHTHPNADSTVLVKIQGYAVRTNIRGFDLGVRNIKIRVGLNKSDNFFTKKDKYLCSAGVGCGSKESAKIGKTDEGVKADAVGNETYLPGGG